MRKLTVATFSEVDKAEKVKNRLERAGIPATVLDESKLQRLWFLSKPLAAEKVQVSEKDLDRAREVLQIADSQEHLLNGEIKCPQCGSPRVEYPQFTRKFMTTTLVEVLCLLHVIDRAFYCKDCQHTWPGETPLRPTTDRLKWPHKEKERGLVKKEQ
jgi:hypothetical protein